MAYLKFQEFGIYNLSPPLMRAWMALPAYLAGATAPPAKPHLDELARSRHLAYAKEFEEQNPTTIRRYIVWGRFMAMPFSVGCAWLVFGFARKLYGRGAGLLACAAWSFSPSILAHGSTLGTDIPTTFLMLAAVATWRRFLAAASAPDRSAAARRAHVPLLWSSLFTGLAHATKFSSLLLWPILVALIVGEALLRRHRHRRHPFPWMKAWTGLAICLILTFVIVNGSYLFKKMGEPLSKFAFQSSTMRSISAALPGRLPIPFHHALIEGFDAQKWEAEDVYVTALFGRAYVGSDWRYYPWVGLTKSTVGGLLLAAVAIASLFFLRPKRGELIWMILLIGGGAGMATAARLNLGVRYLLPAYPALIILMSRSFAAPALRIASVIAISLLTVESLMAAPRFNSFSNVLLRHHLSNVPDLDWGQSLIDLHDWMRDNDQRTIKLVHFGDISPAVYGVHRDDLMQPITTSFVAIGRKSLDGLPHRCDGHFTIVRGWRKLNAMSPMADLGGMLVFRADDVLHSVDDGGPWIREVHSWDEARSDPTLTPIDNFWKLKNKND